MNPQDIIQNISYEIHPAYKQLKAASRYDDFQINQIITNLDSLYRIAKIDKKNTTEEVTREFEKLEKILTDFEKKSFEDEFGVLQKEHDDKVKEYETKSKLPVNQGGWPEAIRQSKAQALADLEQNMMDFQQTANDELGKLQDDKLKPLIEEFDAAVAKRVIAICIYSSARYHTTNRTA